MKYALQMAFTLSFSLGSMAQTGYTIAKHSTALINQLEINQTELINLICTTQSCKDTAEYCCIGNS